MGSSKLSVNVARFALENKSVYRPTVIPGAQKSARNSQPEQVDPKTGYRKFSNRDFRSYSDVLGNHNSAGGSSSGYVPEVSSEVEKSLIVPDRTGAFKDLHEVAVVGRTVDLETLVDFDKLLRIAKISASNIQYLGGLSILSSFGEKSATSKFLDSRKIWGPWFSKLDVWSGQCLPLERVAWLRVVGIPLHLFDPETLTGIGELFGKVLYAPKGLEEDADLSGCRVGVLVGEVKRIKESVTLKWKERSFRVWVEEEQEGWVPDCLEQEGSVDCSDQECSSPLCSSPVVRMEDSDSGDPHKVGGQEEVEKSGGGNPVDGGEPCPEVDKLFGSSVIADYSHANGSLHEDRPKSGAYYFKVGEEVANLGEGGTYGVNQVGPIPGNNVCGASFSSLFNSVDKSKKSNSKKSMGSKIRRAQKASCNKESTPNQRPKKRPRAQSEDNAQGFGFIGFTDRAMEANKVRGAEEVGEIGDGEACG
ncbi:hypothetical protein HanPI659440_Chr17g0702331 [Helianthus annuus]|nr:hypothetical protein HanPI659440_Chr17g0702331 [Helianthus annuus]